MAYDIFTKILFFSKKILNCNNIINLVTQQSLLQLEAEVPCIELNLLFDARLISFF